MKNRFRNSMLFSHSKVTAFKFAVIIVLTICILDLIGWIFDITLLKSIYDQWTPMKLITALCFTFYAFSLLLIEERSSSRFRINFAKITGAFISIISIISIAVYIYVLRTDVELPLVNTSFLKLFLAHDTRMALFTAVVFLILGIILILLSTGDQYRSNIAHLLIIPAAVISYLVPVSYILGVNALMKMEHISVGLNTGIAFCLLCFAILFIRKNTWVMEVFTGSNAGSILARKLLPGLLILPVVIGWFRIYGEQNGFYESEVGVILVAMTYIVSFMVLLWYSARSANRIDDKRRKSEEAERLIEQRFETTLSSIGDAVISTDIVGNITFLNPVAEALTGWTLKEASQKPVKEVFNIINEASRMDVESPVAKVLETGLPVKLTNHTVLIRKDGTEVYIDDSAAPIIDKDGSILGAVLVFRDISDRRKADQALRESEQRLRFHFENSPLAVVEWDAGFIVTQWSIEAEHIFGWKKEETLGRRIDTLNMIYEEDLPIVNSTMEKLTSRKETMVVSSNRNYTKSGAIIECEWYNSVLLDKNGQMTSVMSLVQDITVRKRAEQALLESEQKFEVSFQSAPIGMSLADLTDGALYDVNQAWLDMVGYTQKEEVIGMTSVELGLIPDADTRESILNEFGQHGSVRNVEMVLCVRSGEERTVLVNVDTIDINGRKYMLSTNEDITERKKIEKERSVTVDFLHMVNECGGVKDLIHSSLTFFQNLSGCDAIGIRLKEGEDYPYFESNGFTEGFLLSENYLCARDKKGKVIHDHNEKPIIECLCGNVICGRLNTPKSAYTEYGSFCSNRTSDLQVDLTENDIQSLHIRNRCNRDGYESVALIPLKIGQEQIGLIQLNDKRLGAFASEMIMLMERLAGHFVVALARLKAEEALLIQTENLRQQAEMLEYAPVLVRNMNEEITIWNAGMQKLYGFSRSEAVGKISHDLLQTGFPQPLHIILDHLYVNGRWEGELKHKQKDGVVVEVLSLWVLHKDSLGNPAAIIEVNKDITARKEAEHTLNEAREKLDLALDNGNIGTFERDFKTNQLIWDTRMERMFGFEEGTFEGTYETFEKCLVEEDIPHLRRASRKAVEENVPFESVYRIKLPNGNINYVNAKGLVIRDEEGKAAKLAGVCFDVTDMKKGAENVLFKLNEELHRSNKELEQFAYIASHDLQEPLRMVSSFTQLLQKRYKDKLDGDAQEFIQYAVDGAMRMQRLINDLLNYSRIGTKGQNFTDVDFNQVLDRTINNLKLSIEEKNALVTFDKLPSVKGDEGQLIQLMQNLIGNALKFCSTSPLVHISVKEESNHYVFSVHDNGIGMEPQYFDRIFLIFQRLVPKDAYGGTGIGLAICKRVVERHNGKIWVESQLGVGTTFYFTIIKSRKIKR